MQFLERRRAAIDISYGGVRIYSDLEVKVGQLLKLELFAQDAPPVTYTAEVAWVGPMPDGGVARFDVGLRFLNLEPAARDLLVSMLGPTEDASDRPSDTPDTPSDEPPEKRGDKPDGGSR